uniref:NET domain-containing protein n=1 Tax=viral metagenome TaxID=1070528 RepID=A0A6C0LRM6_9ZZZZ
MDKKKSKYSHDDRKRIVKEIEGLKNDTDYIAIFEILTESENSYTQNSNGVFLNLSKVNDKTLDKINKYLCKVNKRKISQIDVKIDIIPDSQLLESERTYKLSNYEKNILKQRELKKVLNEEIDYEIMRLSSKKTNKLKKNNKSISA